MTPLCRLLVAQFALGLAVAIAVLASPNKRSSRRPSGRALAPRDPSRLVSGDIAGMAVAASGEDVARYTDESSIYDLNLTKEEIALALEALGAIEATVELEGHFGEPPVHLVPGYLEN